MLPIHGNYGDSHASRYVTLRYVTIIRDFPIVIPADCNRFQKDCESMGIIAIPEVPVTLRYVTLLNLLTATPRDETARNSHGLL